MNETVMSADCRFSTGTKDNVDNIVANEALETESNGTVIKNHPALEDSHKPVEVFAEHNDTTEVNMEATITADDVMRAGGFGARDVIGSFLPVAIDYTDFEASLRDAQDYEEPQGEILRPGLGWTGTAHKE